MVDLPHFCRAVMSGLPRSAPRPEFWLSVGVNGECQFRSCLPYRVGSLSDSAQEQALPRAATVAVAVCPVYTNFAKRGADFLLDVRGSRAVYLRLSLLEITTLPSLDETHFGNRSPLQHHFARKKHRCARSSRVPCLEEVRDSPIWMAAFLRDTERAFAAQPTPPVGVRVANELLLDPGNAQIEIWKEMDRSNYYQTHRMDLIFTQLVRSPVENQKEKTPCATPE